MKSPARYIHHLVMQPGNSKRKHRSSGYQVYVRGAPGNTGRAFFGYGGNTGRTRRDALRMAVLFRNLTLCHLLLIGPAFCTTATLERYRRVLGPTWQC